MSLETQKRYCEKYAERSSLSVIQSFGGTYESAKTDERKEFKRMLDFVKRQQHSAGRISYIIVYSADRFSRSGANAIYIASELKKQGISVISVTQPTDSHSASGNLQQNIQFIFSEYDNQLRREKCLTGTKERLLQGYWVTKAPLGYDQVTKGQTQVITVNKEGELLRKAFEWKAEGLMTTEIVVKLSRIGLRVTTKRLSALFRNVFYCGLLSHNLLEGKVVEGRHPALIDKETFLRANEVLQTKRPDFKATPEEELLPLKRFVKCGTCGTTMVGYEVKKKHLHYYKCNKTGCKTNKSAVQMHETFKALLKTYQINPKLIAPLELALKDTFQTLQKQDQGNTKALKDHRAELTKKLEQIEERFVLAEITRELYEKFSGKFRD